MKLNKNRTTFLAFCRDLRGLYPPEVRIAIVMDNFSPHMTKKDQRVHLLAERNAKDKALCELVKRATLPDAALASALGARQVGLPGR